MRKLDYALNNLEGVGKLLTNEAQMLRAFLLEHPDLAREATSILLQLAEEALNLHQKLYAESVKWRSRYEDNSAEALRELL